MAGGQRVSLYGYEFTARPLSRWRRLTGDFLPYWQASRPKFVLTATNLQGRPTHDKSISWFVRFAQGDSAGGNAVIPSLRAGETVNLVLGPVFLGFTGDTLRVLPTVLSSTGPAKYETVYAFHTTHKTWVFLAVSAGVLAGGFAILGQWLFGA